MHTAECQQLREEFREEIQYLQRSAATSSARTRPSYSQMVVAGVPPSRRGPRPVPQMRQTPPPTRAFTPGFGQADYDRLAAFFRSEGLTPSQVQRNLSYARWFLTPGWKPRQHNGKAYLPEARPPGAPEDSWWAWAEMRVLMTLLPPLPSEPPLPARSRTPPTPSVTMVPAIRSGRARGAELPSTSMPAHGPGCANHRQGSRHQPPSFSAPEGSTYPQEPTARRHLPRLPRPLRRSRGVRLLRKRLLRHSFALGARPPLAGPWDEEHGAGRGTSK